MPWPPCAVTAAGAEDSMVAVTMPMVRKDMARLWEGAMFDGRDTARGVAC